jgi:hypothetical protein
MKLEIEKTGDDAVNRVALPKMVTEYKLSYEKLKEFKLEIEHLQHLLDTAKHRMLRDFEHWHSNVYESIETLEPATIQEANEKPKFEFQRPFTPQKYSKVDKLMNDDIAAFYEARQDIKRKLNAQ